MAQSSKRSSRRRLATRKSSLERSLNVSLAGARAGTGVALGSLKRRLGIAGEQDTESAVLRREADNFAAELGRLKGSYVKIGQLMAQFGEHFLPPELSEALHSLGSSTEALQWADIEPQIKQSLGVARFSELSIHPEAIAAASLAQVHEAELQEQTGLVLKVLYPGLRQSIDSDFDAVIRMLKLGRWLAINKELDHWTNNLRIQLQQETDYRREATVTKKVGQLAADLCEQSPGLQQGSLLVPKVIDRYCRGEVLALEKMRGYAINSDKVQGLSQRRRNQLGKCSWSFFSQKCIAGA